MIEPPNKPVSVDGLMLWVIEALQEEFGHEFVLKGGMALRLLDSPRATRDLDATFVPHQSKTRIRPRLEKVLTQLADGVVKVDVHSTMIRGILAFDDVSIAVEASVAESLASEPISTAPLAEPLGRLARVIRVMAPNVALAHKLAAWNERRLIRDLYDVHFWIAHVGARIDLPTLDARLSSIRSRLPKLRSLRKMTRVEFVTALEDARRTLAPETITEGLAGLISENELVGLRRRITVSLARCIEQID